MDAFVDVIERFQVLVTGLLAIFAALIAYRGAVMQARALRESAEQAASEGKRAAAGAFWAELSSCLARLRADRVRIEHELGVIASYALEDSPLPPIDTSIYDADASAIGRLPPDDAYVVASAYKLVKGLNEDYARFQRGFTSGVREVRDRVALADRTVEMALRGLRTTAQMPQEMADAVLQSLVTSDRGSAARGDESHRP